MDTQAGCSFSTVPDGGTGDTDDSAIPPGQKCTSQDQANIFDSTEEAHMARQLLDQHKRHGNHQRGPVPPFMPQEWQHQVSLILGGTYIIMPLKIYIFIDHNHELFFFP